MTFDTYRSEPDLDKQLKPSRVFFKLMLENKDRA